MKARIPMTNQQKKAMNAEIMMQLAEYDKANLQEIDAMVLWLLYSEFGFGKKRLRRFYDQFAIQMNELIDRYEMSTDDTAWLCTRKLKDAGIDISQWLAENEKASQNTILKS